MAVMASHARVWLDIWIHRGNMVVKIDVDPTSYMYVCRATKTTLLVAPLAHWFDD
jgi:hypothetical protein